MKYRAIALAIGLAVSTLAQPETQNAASRNMEAISEQIEIQSRPRPKHSSHA